jgi:hypothetical protein
MKTLHFVLNFPRRRVRHVMSELQVRGYPIAEKKKTDVCSAIPKEMLRSEAA